MRVLENWIDTFCEYTEDTESHPLFNKWVAYSVISMALRKKVKFELGRISIFPNLYVVLIAEPGVARKSQAISYAKPIIKAVPDIHLTADAITREALLEEFEAVATDDPLPNGDILRHASLSIVSSEFETFLGQKVDNTRMLVLLTEFFDCGEEPFHYKTKNRGEVSIPSVYLSMLGATTPESLASSLPTLAIGGGLTSRIIFVYAKKRSKKVAIPKETDKIRYLRKELAKDLFHISRIAGTYTFDREAEELFITWYNELPDESTERICTDPTFNGWYSRKHVFVCKMCQVNAAARAGSSMLITADILRQTIKDLEEIEPLMEKVFSAIGRSFVTADVDKVMDIIKTQKQIDEKKLLSMVWRDMDAFKFDNVIRTAIKTGNVKRTFSTDGIMYTWCT